MFDPNFDPFLELENCQHNVRELVKAVTQQGRYLSELTAQHEQLAKLLALQDQRIARLEYEISLK
jgi:hypothetical protein